MVWNVWICWKKLRTERISDPYGHPDAGDERLRCGKKNTWAGRPPKSKYPHHRYDANAFTEDRQVALDAGMNDHIAKPINMNVLVPTLRKYL